MEAKLPNINAAFIYWRSQSVKTMALQEYPAAQASLDNINALFPERYKVSINTKEFNKLMEERIIYQCKYCNTETNCKDIEIIDVIISVFNQTFHKSSSMKIWICPKCSKENDAENTRIIRDKMKGLTDVEGAIPSDLFFLKVVPRCPVKQSGISNRLGFKKDFEVWFYRYLRELEYQLGLYRIEYRSQNDGEDMDSFKDDGKD